MIERDAYALSVPVQSPPMRTADIQPHEASEVLYQYGRDGYSPGDFAARLIATMDVADTVNLAKLGAVFPGYAAAVHLMKTEPTGPDRLAAIRDGDRS